MNEQLPPLPRTCNWQITPEEDDRLNAKFNLGFSPTKCVTCGGDKTFRWYSQDDRSKIVQYDCNCRDQWKMHRYFLSHGVPIKYQRLGLLDAAGVGTKAAQVVADYFDDREDHVRTGMGLFLHGTAGTGKTLLGTLVLKQFLADGYDGMFSSFYDILGDKSRGWTNPDEARYFNKRIRSAKVLMIDDPGKEFRESVKQIAFGQSLLDEILRSRNGDELLTIITSNHRPEEFTTMYGEYIGSLIKECMIIKSVIGEDYRVEKKARDVRENKSGLRRPITIQ